MKTILIPIFHGHIARNILRTGVLSELTKEANVVLVVPNFKKELYEKEFGSERVSIVASPKIGYLQLDRFFRSFYYYFVDTETVRITQQEQFILGGKRFRYIWSRIWTNILGHTKILRQTVRWLDGLLVEDILFTPIFDQFKPDLVFIPSLTSDDEGLVLRQARRRNIPTVGMFRSWDTVTVNKGNLRIFPDRIIVHTELLKEDVVKYTDYPSEKIEVVGMSHFDYYITDNRIPREKFFEQIGGSPLKKTVYFMPIGLSDQNEDKYMLSLLESWVKNDPAFENVQLMISSHPNATKPIDYASPETLLIKFPDAIDFPGGKPTDREITKTHMELMASGIYHSDVVVNYQGTTSIDAAAFDKPVINIAFDAHEGKPYLKSVRRFYDFTHYQPILHSGGVRLAHSPDELKKGILDYFEHPERDQKGRERLVREQTFKYDGKASERTAHAILSLLK